MIRPPRRSPLFPYTPFSRSRLPMNRAAGEAVFKAIVALVTDSKTSLLRHKRPIYENPSPGNTAGGLTTLEEKSLGAVQKGGTAPVTEGLRYGEGALSGGGGAREGGGSGGGRGGEEGRSRWAAGHLKKKKKKRTESA